MKRPVVILLVLAAICVIVIPFWALADKGSEDASPQPVASQYEQGQQLFQINCGTCHTLAAAGTDGVVGPNLDTLFSSQNDVSSTETTVLQTIQHGLNGRMPAGIVRGQQAREISEFVANNVNYISAPTTSTSTTSGSSSGATTGAGG
jgi:mono/diheme cytochrome c family protein